MLALDEADHQANACDLWLCLGCRLEIINQFLYPKITTSA